MPHNLSAAKRLRKNESRRLRNKARLTELKTIRKKLARALHDGAKVEAEGLYKDLTKRLDQAASVNTVHKNSAARVKSRLAIQLSKIGAAAVVKAKPVRNADKPAGAKPSAKAATKPAAK